MVERGVQTDPVMLREIISTSATTSTPAKQMPPTIRSLFSPIKPATSPLPPDPEYSFTKETDPDYHPSEISFNEAHMDEGEETKNEQRFVLCTL